MRRDKFMYDKRTDVKHLIQETKESLNHLTTALQFLERLIEDKYDVSDFAQDEIDNSTKQQTEPAESLIGDSKFKPKDNPVKEDRLPTNTFIIKRQLSGANLVDSSHNQIAYYSESLIHQFDWQTGDLSVVDDPDAYLPKVTRIIKQRSSSHNQEITEFRNGIVEQTKTVMGSPQLVVDRNIYRDYLGNINPLVERFRISDTLASDFNIEPGDLVTLAWYKNNPSLIKIRWRESLADKRGGRALTASKTVKESSTNKQKDQNKSTPTITLNYDLAGQTVGVIVGDKQRSNEIADLIKRHGGVPRIIDGFFRHAGIPDFYSNQLNDCDIAILVQNYSKHSTSSAVLDTVKDNQIKFAIANSIGSQAIDRAIYRADQGLPDYEPAGGTINYPELTK